jgi:two-component system, OmpR family, phosphate regulon sensor histidine kinase PhoR
LFGVLRHSVALLPLVMIPFGLLVRAGILPGTFYAGDTLFISIVGAYTLTSVAYLYLLQRAPKRIFYGLFLVVFHILLLLFVLLVGGLTGSFIMLWILLLLSADIAYSSAGFFASFGVLVLADILAIASHSELRPREHLEIIQGTLIAGLSAFIVASMRNFTEQERATLSKSREQEGFEREQLLALVNSMGDAVVTTNEKGTIKVYNAALLSLLDTNANLTGKLIDNVLDLHGQHGERIAIMDDARTIRKVFSRTDLSHRFSADDSIRLYINVAPIRPSYQSHTERGYIFIIRDITKEKTLEEERDEFISVVSHELRTPIAIAEGNLSNIQILQDRGASPEVLKRAAGDAHEQIMYLAKMVNDLATLSRAERGINTEGTEEVDPVIVLTELYKAYLPRAHEKRLHLNLDLGPRLPRIRTSRLYVEEILQNFLTNALKYTHEGSITLAAHNTAEGVYIAVKDTGIGIGKADQHHIFEKFYRSEDYRTRESNGTGLGLYIAKKLAEKMNIKMHFESRLNHGSTFSITVKPTKPART